MVHSLFLSLRRRMDDGGGSVGPIPVGPINAIDLSLIDEALKPPESDRVQEHEIRFI